MGDSSLGKDLWHCDFLFQMNERQMRMERRQMAGKIRGTATQKFYTTAATNARSILEKAVVAYIDRWAS